MSMFKYFSPNRSAVFEDCALRVTPFSELNDPFEAAPVFAVPEKEHLESRLRRLIVGAVDSNFPKLDPAAKQAMVEDEMKQHLERFLTEASLPHHWENAAREIQQKISKAWGAICLSECRDDLLMWSHYADGHQGFVLGFDETHHQFREARPVIYSKVRPIIHQEAESPTEFYRWKAESWAYERERRVFMELIKCDHMERMADNRVIYSLRIDPTSVVSVILGSRVPQHVQSMAARAIATKRFPRARLKIALTHPTEFKIDIQDVSGGGV